MLLLEFILRKKDKILQIDSMVIQDKDTAYEKILQTDVYITKDWLTKIKELYDDYSEEFKQQEIYVRCVIVETDVITSTTSTMDKKSELSLLRENISMFNHQLFYDSAYLLDDTDYFIVSLVDNDLIHDANKIKKLLKLNDETFSLVTQNNLVLSLINRRHMEGRSVTDYGIVIKEHNCWKVYVVAEEGIPYRILEVNSEEEVCSIFYSGSINKAILLSCGSEIFNVKSIIKINRGVLTEQQTQILYMYEPVEDEVEIEVEADDVLLLKNSIDYEGVSRWLLPKRVVAFCVICLAITILIMASMSFFILSDSGSEMIYNKLNEVLGGDVFKTNSEMNQQLMDVVYKACSLAGLSDYDISVSKEIVTVTVSTDKMDEQITYLIDILEDNHYFVVVDTDEDTKTRVIQVSYEELDLDIDTKQIVDNTKALLNRQNQ